MKPPIRDFRSPFELGLVGLCIAAIVFVIVLIGLYLTDAGMVKW